jgi:RNA polymerase subunit RPABC4/transcription elongation factor Spt4
MSELMSQFITPQVQSVFTVVIALLVILYVLVVVWVARDAYHRGAVWWLWAIVSLVPIVGVIAYCLLRPSLLQVDRDEQELEIALKQRELMKYGECANCGYPVEADYVLCPNCHQRLKNQCSKCGHALDPAWSVCPYCATPVGTQRRHTSGGSASAANTRRTSNAPAQARQQQQRQARSAQPSAKAPQK